MAEIQDENKSLDGKFDPMPGVYEAKHYGTGVQFVVMGLVNQFQAVQGMPRIALMRQIGTPYNDLCFMTEAQFQEYQMQRIGPLPANYESTMSI